MTTSMPLAPLSVALLLAFLVAGCSSTPALPPGAMNSAAATTEPSKLPDEQPIFIDVIQKLENTGQYYAAIAYLDEYDRRWHVTPQTQLLRATAYRKTGRLDDSAQIYRAMLHGPLAAHAQEGLGLVEAEQGHLARALTHFHMASEISPTDVGVLNNLGYAALQARDWSLAEETLFKAGQLAPADKRVWSNIAVYMLATNHPYRAERVMDRFDMNYKERGDIHRTAARLGQPHQRSMNDQPGGFKSTEQAPGIVNLLQPRITSLYRTELSSTDPGSIRP